MKIIVDVDTGNDDAWAIISLLRAEEICDFKVIAITCVAGNTTIENSVCNTLKVLEICNRQDVPVYPGAKSSLLMNSETKEGFHGIDGLNDVYNEKLSMELAQKKNAVEAIRDYIDNNPNEITIISLAPLTNIALLYKMYPEVIPKISSHWIMGGNHQGIGNITKHAEFNFYTDPEAAFIVFNESKCQIYIFPWEACIAMSLTMSFEQWRIKILSSNENAYTKFLNPVEIVAYKKYHEWMPCDAFLAVCFIMPKIITNKEEHHISIELAGNHTRGMMVIDHMKTNLPNATIIKEIDVEMFKNFMLYVCHHHVDDMHLRFDKLTLNDKIVY
ncbi:hypothetical protein PVAND_012231 [Polypedilum vanderplanki]|uniref:Inosine/uridine-preferring nucleoside hydrolase domain-containing protein n=1 Tax=Polypedilum vanderplanki TaxID=319348 RepID=A0A9J6CKZ0_POLVA|nr:hypothetical protein PVAND_012231 [Polypedilum vanderplanki]